MGRSFPLKIRVKIALRQFAEMDLRWSYYASGGLVILGLFVNLLLPHGWTVWPFVMAGSILLMVNEAADRNGSGLPPLLVYGLAAGAMVFWIIVVCVLSVVNPIILLLGIAGMGYYCAREFLRRQQMNRVIAVRRQSGLCIYCGHPADPKLAYCDNCGREPNPDAAVLDRILHAQRPMNAAARARAAIKPESIAASAARKEQALIARRRTGKGPRR